MFFALPNERSAPGFEKHFQVINLETEMERAPCASRWQLMWISAGMAVLALAIRLIFFEGLWGSDDLAHVHYAIKWNYLPTNHWETRLLFNTLLRGAILMFGMNEPAYALPSLLASIALVTSSVWCAGCLAGTRAAFLSGLLAASLPIDIIYSTVPVAMTLSAGLAGLGTTLLLTSSRPFPKALACLVLALAIIAHLSALFYVGALVCALLLTARTWSERRQALTCGAAAVLFFAAIEFTLFMLLTGDPLYEFRVLGRTHLKPAALTLHKASNMRYLKPVMLWVFSKDFGVMLVGSCIWALSIWRTLSSSLRVLAITSTILWLWISYGTRTPTSYLPLSAPRFAYTLALPLAVLMGCLFAQRCRWGNWAALTSFAFGILLVACSGSWGQRIEVTKEFLPYIQAHPHTLFLADDRTQSEIFICNQGRPLTNVVDWNTASADSACPVAILVNPLAGGQPPEHLKLGSVLHSTTPAYRSIAALLPQALLLRYSWLVRRPSGQIVQLANDPPHEEKKSQQLD